MSVEVTGTVQGQQVEGKLPIIVVASNGPTLLGRDWLEGIRLEWGRIKLLRITPVEKLQDLLQRYEDVFSEETGQHSGVKAKIVVNEHLKPRLYKARPVPHAIWGKGL